MAVSCGNCGDTGLDFDLDPCSCPPGRALAVKQARDQLERDVRRAKQLLEHEGYTVVEPAPRLLRMLCGCTVEIPFKPEPGRTYRCGCGQRAFEVMP